MSLFLNGLFIGELKPDTTVAGCIDVFENVWPNPSQTIADVENLCSDPTSRINWERAGTLGQGAYQDARTNYALGITAVADLEKNPLLQNIHNQYQMILMSSVNYYVKRYGIEGNLFPEPFSLLRYENSQEYKKHHDGGSSLVPRQVSAICYLNNDYEGGELEFPYFKIKIKPEPGMLILFPSNFSYSHIAHPVTKGLKYNLVTWFNDLPN